MKKRLTLRELAKAACVPERTIRYYISRGIIAPPVKRGPKAAYSEKHKKELLKIKQLQEEGLTLSEISRFIASSRYLDESEIQNNAVLQEPVSELRVSKLQIDEKKKFAEHTSTWHAYEMSEDIIVLVKSGTSSWRIRKITNALKDI